MPDAWEESDLARAAIPNPHCSECGQWGRWTPRADGMLTSGIEHLPDCWVVTGIPKKRWARQALPRQVHPGVSMLREAMKEGKRD